MKFIAVLPLLVLAGCATQTPAPEKTHWLRNVGEGENALRGTRDWTRFETTIVSEPSDRNFALLLRSDANAGTAWFDDVEVVDADGNILRHFPFDQGPEGFRAEHDPAECMAFDATVGHDAAGSLRVSGTDTYNGWLFSHIETDGQERTYTLRGWVKLEKATGKTYAAAAVNGVGE